MQYVKKVQDYIEFGKNEIDLEALRARIDEVYVDGYENIFFLSKLITLVEEKN